MIGALQSLSDLIIQNLWLGPLIALFAGFLTSFTPCSLATFPLMISYVSANKSGKHSALIYSLLFCVGMTVTFTAIGGILAALGRYLMLMGAWWYIVLGILMLFMALVMWGVIPLFKECGVRQTTTRRGGWGAFLLGLLGGAFASPCVTPVLTAIIAVVASTTDTALGIFMLVTYSVGSSILIVLVGAGIGWVNQVSTSKRFQKLSKVIKIVLGGVIFGLGLYLLYLGF